MRSVITLTAHTAIIFAFAMQTDTRCPGVYGSNIGQPYFEINQAGSLGNPSIEPDFEPVIVYEIQRRRTVYDMRFRPFVRD